MSSEVKIGDVIATLDEATIAAEHGGKVRVEEAESLSSPTSSAKRLNTKSRPPCACWSRKATMLMKVSR